MECADCKSWNIAEAVNDNAPCHRYPPVIAWKMGRNGIDFVDGTRPMVWSQDWCGEFVARDTK